MDEGKRADEIRQRRLSRKKMREKAQAENPMSQAGPGRLLAMAEAAGISPEQISAVASHVQSSASSEREVNSAQVGLAKERMKSPPPAKRAKKSGSGDSPLGGLLSGLMGGADPMALAETASTTITGIVTALAIVLAFVLVATVFVIPRGYRIFWLLLVVLTGFFLGGFRLYQEWISAAADEFKDSYRSAAQGILTALTVIYTIVFVTILFALMWKIAVMARRRSDLLDGHLPSGKPVNISDRTRVEKESITAVESSSRYDEPPPRKDSMARHKGAGHSSGAPKQKSWSIPDVRLDQSDIFM